LFATTGAGRTIVRLALLIFVGLSFAPPALAQDDDDARPGAKSEPDFFEDKHLFGFTEGTDVGEAGGKEAEFTTTSGFGKKGRGVYQAVQQEAAFEGAATDRFGYEIGLYGSWLNIANVPGLDNHGQVNFAGFSLMPKYIFLRRGIDAPFGFAISLEPEFERIDNISGERGKNYSMETRVYFDAELIPKKLLVATNIIYLPEVSNEADGGTSRSALFGVTGALSYRITPETFVGGEVEYYQAYQSLGFSNSVGSAVYAGPTLHLQMGPKAFLSLAWSAQLSSSPRSLTAEGVEAWNQADLSRQRARMVFGVEF
jgi:hypothetical protein